MGREFRWEALEAVAATLGIDDMEWLIEGLTDMREYISRIK